MRYFLTILLFICWNTSFAATYEDGENAYKKGNYSKAMSILLPLAEQGNVDAQFYISNRYRDGKGVQQDYQKAYKWARIAAEQGDTSSQYNLGLMYDKGEGIVKNKNEALRWYLLAAEKGHKVAMNNIGVLYEEGEVVEQDYNQAIKWYKLAAEKDDENAQNNLAELYLNGKGVKKNIDEAVKWWKLAAKKGNKVSQINLGWYYMNGFENLPNNLIDYKLAKYWNEQGAENGAPEGYCNLGIIYEQGLGVTTNLEKAVNLYQKAVTEGIKTGSDEINMKEARNRLENLKERLTEIKKLKKIKSNSSIQIDNDPLNIRN